MDNQGTATQATPITELTGTRLSEVLQNALQKAEPLERVTDQMVLASNRARALQAQRAGTNAKYGVLVLPGILLFIGALVAQSEAVVGLVMFFVAVAILILLASSINKKHSTIITGIDAQLQSCEANIRALNQQYDWLYQQSYATFESIPEEYVNALALGTMTRFIANGRADNWKTCVDMFEEQKHRWILENNSAEALALQQQQL